LLKELSDLKSLISSCFIHWKVLNTNNVGFNVDIEPFNMEKLANENLYDANADAANFDILSINASIYIRNKVSIGLIKKDYIELFKALKIKT